MQFSQNEVTRTVSSSLNFKTFRRLEIDHQFSLYLFAKKMFLVGTSNNQRQKNWSCNKMDDDGV